MSRPTRIQIDLSALRHNVNIVKQYAPHKKILAMVKANAYGHGLARVASALEDVDMLGVASLEEGLTAREAGVHKRIALMEGLFTEDEVQPAAEGRFDIIIHHADHLNMLQHVKLLRPFFAWLKINTGMHRLGIAPEQLSYFHAQMLQCDNIHKPFGFMTHFAEADNRESEATKIQMTKFAALTNQYSGPKSLANSAGILAWPEAHADWVRPGIILYGASPFAGTTGLDFNLQPVMTLSSAVIAIVHVKKGERVGYGGTWDAPKDSVIAVVGAGYGDGYPQFAKNGTPILVNGHQCTLAGRVSMDMLMVDITTHANIRVGDPVILWGKGLPVETVAKHSATLAYEILTRMTPRSKIEVLA